MGARSSGEGRPGAKQQSLNRPETTSQPAGTAPVRLPRHGCAGQLQIIVGPGAGVRRRRPGRPRIVSWLRTSVRPPAGTAAPRSRAVRHQPVANSAKTFGERENTCEQREGQAEDRTPFARRAHPCAHALTVKPSRTANKTENKPFFPRRNRIPVTTAANAALGHPPRPFPSTSRHRR